MHHMVTTEHAAKRRGRQRVENADPLPRAGQKACTFRRAAVRRLQDQSAPTGPQPLTRLVESCDRLAGSPGKPHELPDPLNQHRLKDGRKIGGHSDGTARGPCEYTPKSSPGAGGF
jgi:hypothetical protein